MIDMIRTKLSNFEKSMMNIVSDQLKTKKALRDQLSHVKLCYIESSPYFSLIYPQIYGKKVKFLDELNAVYDIHIYTTQPFPIQILIHIKEGYIEMIEIFRVDSAELPKELEFLRVESFF